ncbi:acyl-CoA dehydrogenase family protein [Novosphingobium sp. YJ-S2-02]|uniref:Acyl-CoA dehydrogenase family protein n=1 Tax=Novosphingobium aureum TaxID=2792964 RepID=A0A931HAR5_9SPHN|nr:acyl-CoA dehydrogenase [Novosphingobium aureum]MBH0112041.1 acyl-CoA dehydrogenase family protein [Novosphingobium aureum]
MNFELSEEQSILKDTLERYLADHYDFDTRCRALRGCAGPTLWPGLVEMGLTGAPFPLETGGHGGGPVEAMIVMEALGAALACEPWNEAIVLCGSLLAELGAQEHLAPLIEGSKRHALAHAESGSSCGHANVGCTAMPTRDGWQLDGTKALSIGAGEADTLLVSARTDGSAGDEAGISLFALPRATVGVTLHPMRMIDDRACCDIELAAVRAPASALVGPAGMAYPALERAHEAWLAALCSEAVGVVGRLHQDTVAYTRQRRQFGQPLSNFQVIQHRLVDMLMQVELATSACHLATLSLDKPQPARRQALTAAALVTGEALRFVGESAVQLHGAMGLTDELAISHLFRRATAIIQQLGSIDQLSGACARALRAA